ncbi:unnamed protein product, partial [Closterium sp. NIES-64]
SPPVVPSPLRVLPLQVCPQVDAVEPVEVTGDSGAAAGAELRVSSLGVLCLGVLSLGVLSLGVLSLGVLSLGVLRPGGAVPWGAELGVLSLGVLCLGCFVLAESHSPHGSCVSGLPGAGGVLLVLVVLRLQRVCCHASWAVLVLWVWSCWVESCSFLELVLLRVCAEPAVGGPTDSVPRTLLEVLEASGGSAGGAAGVGAPDGAAAAVPAVSGVAARPDRTSFRSCSRFSSCTSSCSLRGSAAYIPTPRSYAEAIEGPYSSQWQAAMDAEMASFWKSTGTYVDAVPPPGANIVSGMWIFRVKRPPGFSA